MEIIMNEINKIKKGIMKSLNKQISDEQAFNYLTLWYYYLSNELKYKYNNNSLDNVNYFDLKDFITDGANDGGIDYVYVEDESIQKIILVQSKFTNNIDYNTIIAELKKMCNTVEDFIKVATSQYNKKLRCELQNALDSMPDGQSPIVEYVLFTSAKDINIEETLRRIDNDNNELLNKDSVSIYGLNDIEKKINSVNDEILTVQEYKIKIDKAGNVLNYENNDTKGVLVNISSESLVKMYDKFQNKGLFDLNIRRYIRNKTVDDGIKRTLDKKREDFWFLNNGIIIACKDFEVDGNTVDIFDFSIVNGGQTTDIIGNYKSNSREEFYLPCKIVSKKISNKKAKSTDIDYSFYNSVAEATNSQKPIFARDLKCNSPEMRRLQKLLKDNKILLEIKRGEKIKKKNYISCIKNDEFGQLVISFVHQKPGTARSNKRQLFENPKLYGQIFKVNYEKNINKKDCIIDIILLNDHFVRISESIINDKLLDDGEVEILKNGKQMIFAVLGLIYLFVNNEIEPIDTMKNATIIYEEDFNYGSIISNYKEDDLDELLKTLMLIVIQILFECYDDARKSKKTTSVTNYFKKDSTYIDDIVPMFSKKILRFPSTKKDLYAAGQIFVHN
ncbi:MAG: AIPR family protein [Ruminococcus sp.]|nr:AIPR family protein [Ruminococcus sp.]